jgi:hypothetical protein
MGDDGQWGSLISGDRNPTRNARALSPRCCSELKSKLLSKLPLGFFKSCQLLGLRLYARKSKRLVAVPFDF